SSNSTPGTTGCPGKWPGRLGCAASTCSVSVHSAGLAGTATPIAGFGIAHQLMPVAHQAFEEDLWRNVRQMTQVPAAKDVFDQHENRRQQIAADMQPGLYPRMARLFGRRHRQPPAE